MLVTSLLRLLVEGSGGGYTLVLGSVLVSLLLDEDGDEVRFALVTALVGLLVSCSGGGLFSASASVLVSSLLDEDVDEDRFVVFRQLNYESATKNNRHGYETVNLPETESCKTEYLEQNENIPK